MQLADLTNDEKDQLIAEAKNSLVLEDLNNTLKTQLLQEAKQQLVDQITMMQKAQIEAFQTLASFSVNTGFVETSANSSDASTTTNFSKSKTKKKPITKPADKPQFDPESEGLFGTKI